MTDYHWTPARQRQFLEALAETGCVELACNDVGVSRRAAHNLRWRSAGQAFRVGWDAAVLVARAVVADYLMDRAILGQTLETVRDPNTHSTTRQHYDRHLGRALLARLDRMAEAQDGDSQYANFIRIVSQDFEAFLKFVGKGCDGLAVGTFILEREPAIFGMFPGYHQAVSNFEDDCELEREFAEDAEEIRSSQSHELTPKECADDMHMWFSDHREGWRTDFPPPPNFFGSQEGRLSEGSYSRSLTEEESEIMEAVLAARNEPFVRAGEKARVIFLEQCRSAIPSIDSCGIATEAHENDAELTH
jgi:hypothetical protein